MNRIPKRIWCSCQKYVFFSHLGYRPPVVCQFCWECASHTMTSSVRTSRKSVQSAPQNCFFPFFSVDQATASTKLWWPTTVTAKQKTSRQKQNTSRQNQKPHGKNKNLTAKTKVPRGKATNLTQNQILHSKNKIAWVLPWAFAFPISGNALGGKTKKKKGDGLTPVL